MRNHIQIDRRSLALSRAIVAKIDAADPNRALAHARAINRRWRKYSRSPLHDKWHNILKKSWQDVRVSLLDESETGAQLRQNNPFCGVIAPRERWEIYRNFQRDEP